MHEKFERREFKIREKFRIEDNMEARTRSKALVEEHKAHLAGRGDMIMR